MQSPTSIILFGLENHAFFAIDSLQFLAILQETPQINKNKLNTTCLLGENPSHNFRAPNFQNTPKCEMSPVIR